MIVSLNDGEKKKKKKEEYHFVYSSSGGEIGLEPLIIGGKAFAAPSVSLQVSSISGNW